MGKQSQASRSIVYLFNSENRSINIAYNTYLSKLLCVKLSMEKTS